MTTELKKVRIDIAKHETLVTSSTALRGQIDAGLERVEALQKSALAITADLDVVKNTFWNTTRDYLREQALLPVAYNEAEWNLALVEDCTTIIVEPNREAAKRQLIETLVDTMPEALLVKLMNDDIDTLNVDITAKSAADTTKASTTTQH